MVEPRLGDRFDNARAALDMIPEHGLRQPELRSSQARVEVAGPSAG